MMAGNFGRFSLHPDRSGFLGPGVRPGHYYFYDTWKEDWQKYDVKGGGRNHDGGDGDDDGEDGGDGDDDGGECDDCDDGDGSDGD